MLEREAAAARELAKADGKRKPGRPRKIRTLVREAAPSSAAAQPTNKKRALRRNWFCAPQLIGMIMQAVKSVKGFRQGLSSLLGPRYI